jgi:FkbM family methyltransferase
MHSMPAFNTLGRLRYGQVIYNRNDVCIGRSIELYGEYSGLETSVFNQLLAPGQLVIDAGANIGVHTLFFAKKVGHAGRVLAFEPQRLLFQTLCGNMALNSITNAWCWNMALGDEPGDIGIPSPDPTQRADFGGVSAGDCEGGERVAVTTIDNFELPRCDFIKIDVEGMEEQVLRGAEQTIRRSRPILYVECDRPGREASLLRYLDSLGYRMFWHRPPLFNPHNFHEYRDNVFGETASNNLLCFDRACRHELTGFQEATVPQAA